MSLSDLWNSVERLGSLITLANWGIAATLLIAFACTVIAIKASNRKDELTGAEDLRKAEHIAELDHANLTLRGQVATLETNAANANRDLAGLQKAAADAKAAQQRVETDLAKQQERAATAERSLLELQQTLADQTLSDKQLDFIAGALKEFSGQQYQVVAFWDSKESMAIAERIKQALTLADWKFIPLKEWTSMVGSVVGVMIWIHPNADEPTKRAAEALVAALLREKLQAEIRFQHPDNPERNLLSLSVGSKR